MKGYKGFDKDFKCKDFQYEPNKEFEEDGEIKCCHNGFHFCKNPLDVLEYYPLIDGEGNLNRFAEVESKGKVDTDDKKKFCTDKIYIKAELGFNAFIKASIEFVFKKVGENKIASGYGAEQASSGDWAQQASSGDWAQQASSGYGAQQASSGDGAQQASSGNGAQQASSGNGAQQASSGYGAKQASSGDWAKQASSGDWAKQASSGDWAQQASSGNGAKIVSCGDNSQIKSTGKNAVIANIGRGGLIKGKKGTWITLAEYNMTGKCLCVKSAQIDGEKIKEDVFYQLIKGEFKEVNL